MILKIKRWFRKNSPKPVRQAYNWLREVKGYGQYRQFFAIKEICGGLLPPAVYREMNRRFRDVDALDVVEVGGAAGAGSIAAALALEDAKNPDQLIVVEKCEGGSRTRYGSREKNIERIRANFRTFGVADRVELFPHKLTKENQNEVLNLIQTDKLGGLILDADGRLDRDFPLFWPKLSDGAPIVIDDYADAPNTAPNPQRCPTVVSKTS